jgi:hypothetical protein
VFTGKLKWDMEMLSTHHFVDTEKIQDKKTFISWFNLSNSRWLQRRINTKSVDSIALFELIWANRPRKGVVGVTPTPDVFSLERPA